MAMRRRLLGLLLVSLLLTLPAYSLAQDEEDADADADADGGGESPEEEEVKDFNLRHAIGNLAAYQKAHPDFAAGIGIWMGIGLTTFVIGAIMLLFSEIKAVLVCRDQDFRKQLHDNGYMKPASAGIAELEEKESVQMRPRAYLTVGGMLMMYSGLSCIIYPLCDVLDIVGLPSAPCFVLVVFGAFFAAFCITTFWLFLIWSCTRFYAALAFLVISLAGIILLPSGNLILIFLWLVVAFGGGTWYFKWVPDSYAATGDEQPFWVQDIGEMTVSLDSEDWADATTTTWNTVYSDVADAIPKDTSSLLGAKKQSV
mmetsp:Transcript_31073/g.73780  ORF Transcript_31073/g.73780 Transcript_31073/m.73780 type:complete len:313 (-) Transcript_31073:219-1157(-)